jgi:hypothetical protein
LIAEVIGLPFFFNKRVNDALEIRDSRCGRHSFRETR